MTPAFDAVIAGTEIHATLTPDRDLTAPVWCLSLMGPGRVIEGGALLTRLGGYLEVRLPDLRAGVPHRIRLAHDDPQHRPANRAWLPLGGYLRLADGSCHALPRLPSGVVQPRPGAAARPQAAAAPWGGLRLVPQPAGWEPAEGTLRADAFAPQGDDGADALAAADALARRSGLGALIDVEGVPLVTELDPALPRDGHVLTIGPEGVRLVAAGRDGFLHGAVTLLTLIATHEGRIPCGTITDRPRYGWRGQHLDCARHFYAVPTILRLLDLMALLKMNRFHWHFADDEAFRLEVDCAPDLWRRTLWRGEGETVPGVFGGGIRAGGGYSKDEARQIIAHAAALGIEVLPEVEVPAHALALNRTIPGLRDPDDSGTERSVQGYPDNAVNPAMPATMAFLGPLLAEVAGMFPLGILHLGCDELAPGTWDGSPAADALKSREGLVTRDDLQGWMMARLAGDLERQGIRSAAWEESVKGGQGGIGHDALIFSWTGQGAGIAAARMGHDVVMCPAQHVYLDMAHTADPGDWGAAWAAFVGLEDTVDWRVVPAGCDDIAPRIVGVQGCFWSEFTTADHEFEAMIAPRILGVAVKGWNAEERVNGADLRAISATYGAFFDRIGWDWHRGA
ncbi:MAG: family 20 glycosylhydrolase [Rubellimicrobium sp.]|nr:family 20 glycosylhydrolase [Rubellimicrobium sp.]